MTQPNSNKRIELFNQADIEAALQILHPPGSVFEIRVLSAATSTDKRDQTYSGYFDDPAKAAAAITGIGFTKFSGAYWTLNPVNPALLARANNKLRPAGKSPTTGDKDIVERRWLLIDCDPTRATGIASSDAEHELARQRMTDVDEWLMIRGWPAPIYADSGNGYHLIYLVDLAADDAGLVERVLKAVAHFHDVDGVKIDTSVHNPSRICRLYGTMNCKGDPDGGTLTPPRPWRMAAQLPRDSEAGEPDIVTREQLEQLAALLPKPVAATKPTSNLTSTTGGFDLDTLLRNSPVELTGPEPYQGGYKWIMPVCPWNPDHTGGSAWLIQRGDGVLQAGCQHNSCQHRTWHDFRDILEPGHKERREQRQEPRPRQDDRPWNTKTKPECIGRAKLIRMSDVVPERVQWLWYGRIPLGKVSQFAGNGGLGKSYVSLDIAARVTRGALWPDDGAGYAPLGNVIILNAEDGLADQIRPRLDKLDADMTRIHYLEAIQYPDHEQPFSLATDIERLREAIESVTDVRLIIIDPLSSYLGDIDGNKSADVRRVLDPLKVLAERSNAAIILINHLTKGSGPAVYRACGSIAIQSMVRTSYAFAADQDDEERRLILPTKNNVGPGATGMAYRIVDGRIEWDAEPVMMSADEALEHRPGGGRPTARNDAAQWLRERLAAGPVDAEEMISECERQGFSESTLRRAKRELNIATDKQTGVLNGHWAWRLPSQDGQSPEDCHIP